MNLREDGYVPIRDVEDAQLGMFDKPLPCFGCGIGWFFFLLGFVFPLMWYFSTILYFGKYYNKDPRERSGLAACAIAKKQCYDVVTVHVRAEHTFFNHINTVTVNYFMIEQISLRLCDDALENATFLDILFQSLLEAAELAQIDLKMALCLFATGTSDPFPHWFDMLRSLVHG
ncbi:hypothetical protein DKX38_003897 [Salix brachista]|uniref:Uncharacterized protein n=1 Tax=Salix brachista TaxID=2182728 RepID=A0A5N5NB40_9ROSI|nr:hypothetical protein DKX38_003897 [Salix brachista]